MSTKDEKDKALQDPKVYIKPEKLDVTEIRRRNEEKFMKNIEIKYKSILEAENLYEDEISINYYGTKLTTDDKIGKGRGVRGLINEYRNGLKNKKNKMLTRPFDQQAKSPTLMIIGKIALKETGISIMDSDDDDDTKKTGAKLSETSSVKSDTKNTGANLFGSETTGSKLFGKGEFQTFEKKTSPETSTRENLEITRKKIKDDRQTYGKSDEDYQDAQTGDEVYDAGYTVQPDRATPSTAVQIVNKSTFGFLSNIAKNLTGYGSIPVKTELDSNVDNTEGISSDVIPPVINSPVVNPFFVGSNLTKIDTKDKSINEIQKDFNDNTTIRSGDVQSVISFSPQHRIGNETNEDAIKRVLDEAKNYSMLSQGLQESLSQQDSLSQTSQRRDQRLRLSQTPRYDDDTDSIYQERVRDDLLRNQGANLGEGIEEEDDDGFNELLIPEQEPFDNNVGIDNNDDKTKIRNNDSRKQLVQEYKNPIHSIALALFFRSASYPQWDPKLFLGVSKMYAEEDKEVLLFLSGSIVEKYGVDLLVFSLTFGSNDSFKDVLLEHHEILQLYFSFINIKRKDEDCNNIAKLVNAVNALSKVAPSNFTKDYDPTARTIENNQQTQIDQQVEKITGTGLIDVPNDNPTGTLGLFNNTERYFDIKVEPSEIELKLLRKGAKPLYSRKYVLGSNSTLNLTVPKSRIMDFNNSILRSGVNLTVVATTLYDSMDAEKVIVNESEINIKPETVVTHRCFVVEN